MNKKRLTCIAIIIILTSVCLEAILSYNASLKQQDILKFVKGTVTPANTQCADYEVHIGKNISNAVIITEFWQNGVCIKGNPIILNSQTDQLHITLLVDGFGTNKGFHGLNVQMETNENVSELAYFELPSQTKGYSFTAYNDKEIIEATAGKENILASMAFDMGSGVESMDCTLLSGEPERITSAPCLFIVRAEFTAEQLPLE